MRLGPGRGLLGASLFLLTGGVSFAQYDVGIATPNWTVPAYWTTGSSGGLSAMADISPGVAFVAVSPCRVFDTRGATGAYGGPRLVANATRNFDIDSGPCTGIPVGVDAYSMNFGAILPDGANSFVTIWPTGTAQPVVSTINPIQGGVVANAAIVPAGTNGSISIFPNTGLHLYGDINGYFSDRMGGTNQFGVRSAGGTAIYGENTGSGYGVWGNSATGYGVVAGGGAGGVWATTSGVGSGVYGQNTGGTGSGVYGQHTGSGVYGKSATGFGVVAETGGPGSNSAVLAKNNSATNGASGVFGWASATSGKVFGGQFWTDSSTSESAGVLGVGQGGRPPFSGSLFSAGVRGEGARGVVGLGYSIGAGVSGYLLNDDGSSAASGNLGYGGYGVYSSGPFGGTGAKYLVEPHPSDPLKVIRYVSLEGNESGTYFRGRAKFQNGLATISVPEDFRLVSDPDGLTVQITPIGELATVAVLRMNLNEIVVKSSRNVEFSYMVNGVRKTHKHLTPIGPGREFMPESPDSKMPLYLTEGQKEMLISNGTYKPDGTVNIETARRLGWDKEWEKRRPSPQPAE